MQIKSPAAKDGAAGEHGEFQVEERPGPQAIDHGGHASAGHAIQARLWAVGLLPDQDCRLRGGGESLADVDLRILDQHARGFADLEQQAQLYAGTFRMPIADCQPATFFTNCPINRNES